MSIRAEATIDERSMVDAWNWHWRQLAGWRRCFFPILGAFHVVVSLLLIAFSYEYKVISVLLLIIGYVALMFRRYQEIFFRRSVRKMGVFNKTGVWTFTRGRVMIELDGNRSDVDLTALAHVSITPDGWLFYPMENTYYWLPRTAFDSNTDYQAALEMVKKNATWREVS